MLNNCNSDIMQWSMFWRIDPSLLSEIKFVQVDSRKNAFFVTNEDEVYGIGNNSDGLINGGNGACNEPFRIDSLCGKNIASITTGSCASVYALTSEGDMYVWGRNSEGQLGMNNYINPTTPKLCEEVKMHRIEQVACGYYHTLMLTHDGELFACGSNGYGQLGINGRDGNRGKYLSQPSPVYGLPPDRRVNSIACSTYSSFAIVEGGYTFSWGSNDSGQLGLNDRENRRSPQRVGLEDDLIFKAIGCGYNHTIALTFIGLIYCWGNNKYGQLGFEDRSPVMRPKQLVIEEAIFCEIGANCLSNFNAALTWADEVYVWGAASTPGDIQPTRTNFTSINQAFALMADIPLTVKAIQPNKHEDSVSDCLTQELHDENFCDVTFIFGERKLCAHSAILRIRSEYLRTMLSSNWEKKGHIEIPIKGYSYNVYQAYLHFLYTGEVQVTSSEVAIDLLHLADEYMEDVLKKKCESLVIRSTNIENVFTIYLKARQLSAKEVEEFCFNYAMKYLNAASQTDGFKLLPGDLVKQFISLAGSRDLFKS